MYQSVANLFKAERRKLGLSQEDYAHSIGIKRARLVEWEQMVSEPRFSLTELVEFKLANPKLFEQIMDAATEELKRSRKAPLERGRIRPTLK